MKAVSILLAVASLVLTALVFGFFFAWVCSTMWGLDAADPRVAIAAMQAMNASVRNAVFAPVFFGPPAALALTAVASWFATKRTAAAAFLLAAVVYLFGGIVLTASVNVPMNEALALVKVPDSREEAAVIWEAYSSKWQTFNQIRTLFSGTAFLLALLGFWKLKS